jgi:hypothetical protein
MRSEIAYGVVMDKIRLGNCKKKHALSTIERVIKSSYDLTDDEVKEMMSELVCDGELVCQFVNCFKE